MGEQTITYDAQGNPTNYRDTVLTWEKGRQLKSFGEHTYNANGIRTSKTVGTDTHEYTLDGTSILRETWGKNTLIPLYDNEESVCGIIYNSVPFYFLKNLQGDIIAIVDQEADVVARYSYDAWGVCTNVSDTTQCSIANINPYRYRGYYYDAETKLYYLQSRYYDPEIGRFMNSDDSLLLGLEDGTAIYNLFTYCRNNSVNMVYFCGFVPYKIAFISIKRLLIKTSFSFTFTGSQLATALAISAAVIDVICVIISAVTGAVAAPYLYGIASL